MWRNNYHAKQNLDKNLKKVSKYLICYGFKKNYTCLYQLSFMQREFILQTYFKKCFRKKEILNSKNLCNYKRDQNTFITLLTSKRNFSLSLLYNFCKMKQTLSGANNPKEFFWVSPITFATIKVFHKQGKELFIHSFLA